MVPKTPHALPPVRPRPPQALPTVSPSETPRSAAPLDLVIEADPSVPEEALANLRAAAQRAGAFFAEHYGPIREPLRFQVGAGGLRTGYDFVDDVVVMPNLEGLQQSGLYSDDVIHHEVFHALLLDAYPQIPLPNTPEGKETLPLHEALADHFAYLLAPDDHFGEAYRQDGTSLRSYRTPLRMNLTAGEHAAGNALTSLLLEHQVGPQTIREFLEQGDFRLEALGAVSPELQRALQEEQTLEVQDSIEGYPPSSTGRYWLQPGRPLRLAFHPNPAVLERHPHFEVAWTDKHGEPIADYEIREVAPQTFEIAAGADSQPRKVFARFRDGPNLIGFRPYYLGARSPRSESS